MLKFEKKYIKYLKKCNSIQRGGARYNNDDLEKFATVRLIREYNNLYYELSKIQASVQNLDKEIKECEKDSEKCKTFLENKAELEIRIRELNSKIAELENDFEELSKKYNQLQKNYDVSVSENNKLSNALTTEKTEREKYEKAFDHTSSSLQQLKTRLAEVSKQHHTPGTFGDTDPARPETFTEHHDTIKVTVKLYCNYCVTRFNSHSTYLQFILSNLIKHVQPNVTAAQVGLDDVDFYRALMRASLAKEMFLHFESDTFDATSTTIPAPIDWESQDGRRRNNAAAFKQIMAQTAPDVYSSDYEFKKWLEGLISRLRQAWTLGDETWFREIFNSPEEPKGKGGTIADVFLVNAQKVWALHKLSRAYPLGVQLIRFKAEDGVRPEIIGPDDGKAPKYCINSFNEGSTGTKGTKVAFPVWPGFQLDNFIYPSDVVWIPISKEEEERQREKREREEKRQKEEEEERKRKEQSKIFEKFIPYDPNEVVEW